MAITSSYCLPPIFAILCFLGALLVGICMHTDFLRHYRTHLHQIVKDTTWTDKEKIETLLKAPQWVPTWRLALCMSSFFALLAAVMFGYGYNLHGPAHWGFLFILFFCISTFSQTYRMSHTEGDAMYYIHRIIKHHSGPHESFWDELQI